MAAIDPVTQERVYRALKNDYLAGHFHVGARLDLQNIADRLRASKTPVREAVHRLMGERLLEPDPDGGFRIVHAGPAELIRLYDWNAHLLTGLSQSIREPVLRQTLTRWTIPTGEEGAVHLAGRVGALFLALAEAHGNGEAISSISQLNARLFYVRIAEAADAPETLRELRILGNPAVTNLQKSMKRRLERYHERRIVPLQQALRSGGGAT